MAVGSKTTLCHVLFDHLRPHREQPIGAAKLPDEVEVDPLQTPGRALVLEAGEVLVESPLGQPAASALPAEPLRLVVAGSALVGSDLDVTVPAAKLFKWVFDLARGASLY